MKNGGACNGAPVFPALCDEFVGDPSKGGSEGSWVGVDWPSSQRRGRLESGGGALTASYPQNPQQGGEERDWSR